MQTWDAWVYSHVIIHTSTGQTYDIYNPNANAGGNPIECSEDYYYTYFPDRFRFTFDGENLALNSTHISTVGGSSEHASDLLLAGSWAVCGTVDNNILTPDPYATFVDNHIKWAPNTPCGYTANLLLGYKFEGNDAVTYYPKPVYEWRYVQGTLVIHTYWPKMGTDYPDQYAANAHMFTATYTPDIPESSSITLAISGLLSSILFIRRRKS